MNGIGICSGCGKTGQNAYTTIKGELLWRCASCRRAAYLATPAKPKPESGKTQ